MSNYTKSVNFTVKDTLPTGDASKKIKGNEIDTQYNKIATAINSKADLASPTLLGTPLTTTADAGTNTAQIASTAFVTGAITTAITTVTGSLGTMSTQNANAVAITGGTLTDTSINGHVVGSNATNAKTISTESPSGGATGDVWYKVA